MQLHASSAPAPAAGVAAPEGYFQQAKRTVWNTVTSPEAMIVAFPVLAMTAFYSDKPLYSGIAVAAGLLGTALGFARVYLDINRPNWQRKMAAAALLMLGPGGYIWMPPLINVLVFGSKK